MDPTDIKIIIDEQRAKLLHILIIIKASSEDLYLVFAPASLFGSFDIWKHAKLDDSFARPSGFVSSVCAADHIPGLLKDSPLYRRAGLINVSALKRALWAGLAAKAD